jgi:nitrogen fixation protein NifZ
VDQCNISDSRKQHHPLNFVGFATIKNDHLNKQERAMTIEQLQPGDMIYAATDILNDGSVPDMPEGELIASSGCRGVLINTGHLEEDEDQSIYLVRFEDGNNDLSPPIGCWPEELSAQPANG